ncbi:MAG: hypothetical protein HeimC3_55120 [Candidatus Heimdallarchaeota archaeon LC_3]|nr:MAG: hypothetical protein HeimC3_55120 [Candidatus Heimdallarchaeota archaeon LC_3]
MNLKINFEYKNIKTTRLLWADKEDIVFDWNPLHIFFILRGGSKNSIEQGLLYQAKSLGVEFHFNSRIKAETMDIIATGPKSVHGLAFGTVYKRGSKTIDDEMLLMFNNRVLPKGSYMYAPVTDNHIEIIIAIFDSKCFKNIKKIHQNGLNYFEDYFKGPILREFSGGGNFLNPKSAKINGQCYVGEAAGFQDPFMGFGNFYSIKSGYLAAKSIIEDMSYNKLWKEEFDPWIKAGLATRFFSSLFGDKFLYWFFKTNHERNQRSLTDKKQNHEFSSSLKAKIIINLFSKAEVAKKKITGNW